MQRKILSLNRVTILLGMWLIACIVLGAFMAQKASAVPSTLACPTIDNNTCPTCFTYSPVPGLFLYCKVSTGSYARCAAAPTATDCSNTAFTRRCSGLVNTKSDCTGVNDPMQPCFQDVFSCHF